MAKFKVGDVVKLFLGKGASDRNYKDWESTYGLKRDVGYKVTKATEYDIKVAVIEKQDQKLSTNNFDNSYFAIDEAWLKEKLEKLFG